MVKRLVQQLLRVNPFGGDCLPAAVPLWSFGGRPSLPFPHPWNYERPLDILDSYFHGADSCTDAGRHNRYLDVPGLPPVLVTRDPAVIRAILTATGDRPGQFDRDTLPSTGIARATGDDTLLFGNGTLWRTHRKASAAPFGKTALFQPEVFTDFEQTFRSTVAQRLELLQQYLTQIGRSDTELQLEPEIKAIMLEMLVKSFFGTTIAYQELREVYVPALERVIDHIVRDTVINRWGIRRNWLAWLSRRYAVAETDFQRFDELTDRVLASRSSGQGLWRKFQSDASDEAIRSNVKVFLAGALEATSSYATWAISHLARNPQWQETVFQETSSMQHYCPAHLDTATGLQAVLDETLRLTPSLYFLPRRATTATTVETADQRRLEIPAGAHLLLAVWHANRHADFWGEAVSGYPADQFAPQRWQWIRDQGGASKEFLHYGFGHGARVCPGKHLGQLEVALVVGAFVKLFRFHAADSANPAKAGVSTKPADGTRLRLELR